MTNQFVWLMIPCMPVYRNRDVKAAQIKAENASLEDKDRAWKVYDNLVKDKEALQAQRQTLSEALRGMHVPMHVVLMIIDQSSCVYIFSTNVCRAPCKSPLYFHALSVAPKDACPFCL